MIVPTEPSQNQDLRSFALQRATPWQVERPIKQVSLVLYLRAAFEPSNLERFVFCLQVHVLDRAVQLD